MKNPLWEGVYESFQDVPTVGPGFAGQAWLENSSEKLSEIRNQSRAASSVPSVTGYSDSLLPVIAGIVQGKQQKIRILDFGGGLGFSFYAVKAALANPEHLEFLVIDIAEVCEAGRELFSDEPNIEFHTSLSDIQSKEFDIIHIGSSLQYIEMWHDQLSKLANIGAEYILMANIPAGDIQTFATAQNYYESKIACWFFNVADLTSTLAENSYSIVFKSTYFTKIYGTEQPYPLENFDEQHRIKYPCMLLFQRQTVE